MYPIPILCNGVTLRDIRSGPFGKYDTIDGVSGHQIARSGVGSTDQGVAGARLYATSVTQHRIAVYIGAHVVTLNHVAASAAQDANAGRAIAGDEIARTCHGSPDQVIW